MNARRVWWIALPVLLAAGAAIVWRTHTSPAPTPDVPRPTVSSSDARAAVTARDASDDVRRPSGALDVSDAPDAPDHFDALDAPDTPDAGNEDAVADDADAAEASSSLEDAPDASALDRDAPPQAGFDLTLDSVLPEDRCTLRASSDGVVATCGHQSMRCAVLVRGEFTPDPGDETASRCDYGSGPVFLVLSTASEVLWSDRLDENEDMPGGSCGDITSIEAEAVRVAGQAQRGLMVRVRGCSEPANYADSDEVFWWRDGAMSSAASAGFACSYEGATDGPEMNERGTYDCQGGYLTRAPRTPDTTFTVVGCEQCRQRDLGAGRLMLRRGRVLKTLVWDGESARFAESE